VRCLHQGGVGGYLHHGGETVVMDWMIDRIEGRRIPHYLREDLSANAFSWRLE
jgi:hypothetical protein